MHTPVAVLVTLLAASALAGCVGEEDDAPAADLSPSEQGDAPGAAADQTADEVTASFQVASSAFVLQGETPASVGACGLPEPSEPCVSHLIDAGDHVLEIAHAGNVTAIGFTLTFDAVTPAVTELYHMIHVDDGVTNTMVSDGALTSGDEVALDDLDINTTATITFYAWPVGYDNPLGVAWVDPMNQPFEVEGALTERSTYAA